MKNNLDAYVLYEHNELKRLQKLQHMTTNVNISEPI